MNKIKEKLQKLDKYYIFIFIVSLFLLLPLINNLYFYGHDTGYHIANTLAISENLDFHSLFNLKVLPNIAHNFGYGSGIFYPGLSHIAAAIIYKICNVSIFSAMKITDFIVISLSGIFMYKLMKNITKNKNLSFVSTLFYLTAPYKIYDYIYRDAIAESFIFDFIPLIFLGVYYVLNKEYKKFYLCFIIGYVGIINSHLVMTIYITIFLAIILLVNFKKIWNKEIISRFVKATILVLLICLPFIIPMLNHKINGDYVVFNEGTMANSYGVYGNGLQFIQYFNFLSPSESGLHFLNYVAFILIGYLLYKLIKEKKLIITLKSNYLFCVGFVCFIVGLWMSSHLFPWMIMPNFLLMIQFPWRLGTLTLFGLSILAYYALENIKSKKIVIISIISCLLIGAYCIYSQDFHTEDITWYPLAKEGMGWQEEYLPMKTKNNIDYFNNRGDEIIVINGKATLEIIKNETPNLTFKITDVKNAKLELPRLYYLGYTINVINEKDEKSNIDYQENQNGFIEIEVDQNGTYELIYTGTILDRMSNKVSLITILGFIIYLLVGEVKKNEKRNN